MLSKPLLVVLSTLSLGLAQDVSLTGTNGETLPTLPAKATVTETPDGGFSASVTTPISGLVTSLLLYMADKQPLEASVIGADQSATTLSITCPSGERSAYCGFSPGMTWTQYGTTSFDAVMIDDSMEPVTVDWHCIYDTTKSPICSNTATSPGGAEQLTTTLSSSEISFLPVTITGGTEKLSAASTMKHTPATTTGTSTTTGGQTSKTNAAGKVGVEAMGLGVAIAFLAAL
jgi:hypothetical protein